MGLLKKIKNFFVSKRFRTIIQWTVFACVIIGMIFFLRSCFQKKIAHKQVYSIGRDSSWYSFDLVGREKNLVAFTNDLILLISKETGLRFQWVESSPTALLNGLETGNVDAILSSIRPNVVNLQTYAFSELLFDLGPVLIVTQDSTITSLKEMGEKTIGIRSGSSTIFNSVREHGANIYTFTLFTYGNINRALEALVNNQIDGVIMGALPAYTLTEGFYAGKLKVVTPPLTDEGFRLIALKIPPSDIMIDKINHALEKLKENGAYDALIAKWDLIDAEKDYWKSRTKTDAEMENP